MRSDDWLTPPWIVERFGPFDLDPCASIGQPWPTARRMITKVENGLLQEWVGHVWLNPPYGRALGDWLQRMAMHGDGVALTFARTDTVAFHEWVWPHASTLLFLRGRLTFCQPNGCPAPVNSGGPSVLIAYGERAVRSLARGTDIGVLVDIRSEEAMVMGERKGKHE